MRLEGVTGETCIQENMCMKELTATNEVWWISGCQKFNWTYFWPPELFAHVGEGTQIAVLCSLGPGEVSKSAKDPSGDTSGPQKFRLKRILATRNSSWHISRHQKSSYTGGNHGYGGSHDTKDNIVHVWCFHEQKVVVVLCGMLP